MRADTYTALDAVEVDRLVRSGELQASEVVEAAISRIEQANPLLNAVVIKDYARAHSAAREIDSRSSKPGPFAGLPLLLKDLNAPAAGLLLTQGSRFRRHYVPDYDCAVVERLKRAGSAILGRTNTPEYGASSVTEPELWGATRNPWNPDVSPGGSSGGAAAAVASGMVPLAHGNDAAGSNRIPAAYCGILGVKPSRGRIPNGPELGELWRGMVVDGVLSRSVRDAAAFLDAVSGPDVGAPHIAPPAHGRFLDAVDAPALPMRVGFSTQSPLGVPVDAAHVQAVLDAAAAVKAMGHSVEEAAPRFDAEAFFADFLLFAGVAAGFTFRLDTARVGRTPRRSDHECATRLAAQMGKSVGSDEYEMANFRLRREARKIAAFFESHDVWLAPVVAHRAPPIGSGRPGWKTALRLEIAAALGLGGRNKRADRLRELAPMRFRNGGFVQPANVTGHPALSIPFALHDGMPVAVHLMGRYGEEAALLRLARQFETAYPWASRLAKCFAS
jgi:amidase